MTSRNVDQQQALLDRVSSILAGRLNARRARLAENYVTNYFRGVPLDDLVQEAPATLATIVSNQLDFLQVRSPGETLIRIFNPRLESDGWESKHTIIEMVNDDMPFLVDTATLTFAEMKLGVHLIIHPVMRMKRDDDGRLVSIYIRKKQLGHAESLMQFQVDRRTRDEDLADIERRLRAAFSDTRMAVSDWRAIEKKASDARKNMVAWAPQLDKDLVQ